MDKLNCQDIKRWPHSEVWTVIMRIWVFIAPRLALSRPKLSQRRRLLIRLRVFKLETQVRKDRLVSGIPILPKGGLYLGKEQRR